MKCLIKRVEFFLTTQVLSGILVLTLLGTVFLVGIIASNPVFAKQATPMAKDPVLEEKVKAVSSELRCLVCQNQTIADSDAALAVDLKNQVREMLSTGKTEAQVVDYMVERYGDFVRYRPPVNPATMLLWFGPALFLVLGGMLLFISLKRRSKKIVSSPALSDEESKQVNKLLHAEEKSAEEKDKS